MATDSMEAGAELDAQIAEAMGWTAYRERRGDYELAVVVPPGKPKPWERMQNAQVQRERYTQITCSEAVAIGFFGSGFPRASTDWSAAGEVLEKKRAEGERICLYCDLDGNWNCWFYTKAGEPSHQTTAPTGPLSICLAALKTVRPKKGDSDGQNS